MPDYSFVKDEDGSVGGIWLRDPADAQKRDLMTMLLVKHGLGAELFSEIEAGRYRVVPNNFDSAGGCFVMFGSAPAPGEGAARTRGKRWWEFWQ